MTTPLKDTQEMKGKDDCVCRCHIEGGFCRACMVEKCSFWREPPQDEPQKDEGDWEKEFDKMFGHYITDMCGTDMINKIDVYAHFKRFFREALSSQEERIRREFIEQVDKVIYSSRDEINVRKGWEELKVVLTAIGGKNE